MRRIVLDFEDYDEMMDIETDRDMLLENGEISPEEEAFMRGYDEAG